MEEEITSKQIGKSTLIGLFASLITYLILIMGINSGLAPFNTLPTEALLINVGIPSKWLAILLFFGSGALWSVLFVLTMEKDASIGWGLSMGILLWLLFMTVSSLLIDWGAFGYGQTGQTTRDSPLYLKPGSSYMVLTLLVYLIYGFIVGGLNSTIWNKEKQK